MDFDRVEVKIGKDEIILSCPHCQVCSMTATKEEIDSAKILTCKVCGNKVNSFERYYRKHTD